MNTATEDFYARLDQSYASGSPEIVEAFLQKELRANASGCALCFNPLELTICNELGSLYRGMGQFRKSIQMFERARQLTASHIGPESAEYATVLNNLAGSLRLAGETDKAMETFSRSAEIYQNSIGTGNSFYCSLLNNLALVCIDRKEYGQAGDYLLRALELIRLLPDSEEEQAVTLGNLASLYLSEKDYSLASSYLHQCIGIYENLEPQRQTHLGAAYNSLGRLYFETGDLPKAKTAYQKAREATLFHFGRNHEYEILCRNLTYIDEQLEKRRNNTDGQPHTN